jgi:hypothetical protein
MTIRRIRMKSIQSASILVPLVAVATTIQAANSFVVTASNATANELLVYSPDGKLLQTLSTKGTGGATGNAGGVQTHNGMVAAVNFGSQSVSIFRVGSNGLFLTQVVPTATNPVSVAFGDSHLYVLGAKKVESHAIFDSFVGPSPDGLSSLLVADGSAAQVGVLTNQLVVTEKSNVIETFNLLADGAVSGSPTLVSGIPSDANEAVNANEPFGLATRGNNAYVTIAHDNEIALVRNNAIINDAIGTQNAPCWATLTGPFLYTSNTASQNLSRYAVYGQHIVLDDPIVATFTGNPTDNASGEGLVVAIDSLSGNSHLSIFTRDEDGNLTTSAVVTIPDTIINGVTVVPNPINGASFQF